MFPTAGAALIRVAAYPSGLTLPAWPDLTTDQPEQWRQWLAAVWALPGFATAVAAATPQLAEQITRTVASAPTTDRRFGRMVDSTVRYLLRWTTRATPFGTFAGVAPVEFGARASVRWGEAHQVVTRPDGTFVAEHTGRAEQDLAALRDVAVVTNSVGYQRGQDVRPELLIVGFLRHASRAVQPAVARGPVAEIVAEPTRELAPPCLGAEKPVTKLSTCLPTQGGDQRDLLFDGRQDGEATQQVVRLYEERAKLREVIDNGRVDGPWVRNACGGDNRHGGEASGQFQQSPPAYPQ
ncbi:lantibiotic dehydratase [Micromonospora sp. NPDC049203]|uniref:lantibiotic dehydratase n=1 Tax=Micromonospora sp. NPDC049203 TaxID=3364267 RepID=UPI003717A380